MLEKHVADAVSFPWGSLVLFGIDKVTKYHMDAPLYVTTFAFVFNKARYDEMSPRRRRRSTITARRSGRLGRRALGQVRTRGNCQGESRAGPGSLRVDAGTIGASGRRRPQPLEKAWADNVKKTGVDPDAAMKELKAQLAKFNALAM